MIPKVFCCRKQKLLTAGLLLYRGGGTSTGENFCRLSEPLERPGRAKINENIIRWLRVND